MQTMKSIVTGVAAVAAIGATAVGVASIAAVPASLQVRTVAVGAPLPQDPPSANVPTAGQLTALMNSLVDPNVPFANKSNLIEGGINGMQATMADRRLQKAAANGELPLTFNITNIQPGAPGSATADVTISSPKRPNSVTENWTFVNQGSWMMSRASAIQAVKLLRANGE